MSLIDSQHLTLKVSSVLNKDTKQFGKQYLIDGNDDTCWQSDQGSNQWIECEVNSDIRVRRICIEFQGGFAAKHMTVEWLDTDRQVIAQTHLYANDSNGLQTFDNLADCRTNCLKIIFNQFYDFFGRIIIYKLQLFAD